MRTIITFTAGLMMFAVMQTASAARPLGPPVEELLSNPMITRVVVAVAGEKSTAPNLKFTVINRLSGDSPGELILRVNENIFADLVTGEKYIIAWTDQRKIRLLREGYEKDPEGPSIVQVRGLTTHALYKDSPEIRFLFAPPEEPGSVDAGQQIDALLTQMQRDDYRSRDLVVGQLYLSPDLGAQMNHGQAEKLRNILQMVGLSAQHRDYLLQSALRLPEELRSPWLGEEYRRVIILHGTQYDLSSFVPGLVLNSAKGLRQTGAAADIELLGILLYANNPGVAKAALATMNHFDPITTVRIVEQALERGWIYRQTRHALEQYLKQKNSNG